VFSISDAVWQEDDVVHALTERWRLVATILASGGNQGTLHFSTTNYRRKAPDVVAYCDGTLVTLEAKVRATALFSGAESDVFHLHSLLADEVRSNQFVDRAVELLMSMHIVPRDRPRLVCGLLAGNAFSDRQMSDAHDLVCIEALPGGVVRAVARATPLPFPCLSALS
jgi:hypothetical protein